MFHLDLPKSSIDNKIAWALFLEPGTEASSAADEGA